ncbi:hypothetical protein [Photobacterium leiognathi]|uniref:hypothetical protein n=1 Tax=Photobacterium leiognathi TaxID=553611 RepID=UPI002981614F|nr:hypothetical protein [Photobacterium leiognathi]
MNAARLKGFLEYLPPMKGEMPFCLGSASKEYLSHCSDIVVSVGFSVVVNKGTIDERTSKWCGDGSSHNIIKFINRDGLNLFIKIIEHFPELVQVADVVVYQHQATQQLYYPDALNSEYNERISQQLEALNLHLSDPLSFDALTHSHYYTQGCNKVYSTAGVTFDFFRTVLGSKAAQFAVDTSYVFVSTRKLAEIEQHAVIGTTDLDHIKFIDLTQHIAAVTMLDMSRDPLIKNDIKRINLIVS